MSDASRANAPPDENVAPPPDDAKRIARLLHDLRTPLNVILGMAELLATGQVTPDSPQHAEFLDDILEAGRRMLRLIEDVSPRRDPGSARGERE